jgi:hypothetical protein
VAKDPLDLGLDLAVVQEALAEELLGGRLLCRGRDRREGDAYEQREGRDA